MFPMCVYLRVETPMERFTTKNTDVGVPGTVGKSDGARRRTALFRLESRRRIGVPCAEL